MKKLLHFSLVLGLAPVIAFSQSHKNKDVVAPIGFDVKKATEEAVKKGIKPSEIPSYIDYMKRDFQCRKSFEKSGQKPHTPYEDPFGGNHPVVIDLTPQNSAHRVSNAGCTNMGFEQYNFSNWTGNTGLVSTGTNYPNYTANAGSTITNPAGNNVYMSNTLNYHTIMTLPATSNLYPNCNQNGYDSIAVRAAGTQTISDIPVVSPFSFDPVSVRMNGTNSNNKGCQLKYIVTTSSSVQRLSFSYAVVLENPASHLAGESPYFKVEVRNENTNTVLPGCTSYTFNPKSSLPADSLKTSVLLSSTGDPQMYRKWQYYSVDLSTLPIGTTVSLNFEVGGCTLGGHWGYAYVDAECGGIGVPYSNMCSGSSSAILVAPSGFIGYQWYDPSNTPVPPPQGTNDTLIVNPATPGQVYTVHMVSAGSCTLSLTDTIKLTSVNIINTNSSPSCPGGSSGMAQVTAAGSSGTLLYSWVNSAGTVVGSSATATGLPPGNYTITVASTACGTASAVVNVAMAPPQFYSQSATYCGNAAIIAVPGGSNYQWYHNTTPIPGPAGNKDSLFINTPVVGAIYYLTYQTAAGCRDSIKYTLSLIAGGQAFTSSVNNVCPGNTNGIATINLQTINTPPYNYYVHGPGSYYTILTGTSLKKDSLNNLAPGTYSYTVYDGACIYISTFTITNIATNYTATPTSSVICFPADTAKITMAFGSAPPTSCGTTPVNCTSPNIVQLFSASTPTTSNGSTTYPSPYGNWYTYSKQQYLVTRADLLAAGVTAGKISSLAFNIVSLNTSIVNYPNFEIKMGCTNLTSFTSSFETSLSTVYSNSNQPVALGWNTHNFQQSFLWDGVSNVIISVCFGMNSYPSASFTQNCSVQLVQKPYVASIWHVEDTGPNYCSSTTVTPNFIATMPSGVNMLPNMKFGNCPYAPPPSSYTVSVLPTTPTPTVSAGNGTITVLPTFSTTPTANTPVTYTISVTNPIGNCVKDTVITVMYAGSITDVKTPKDTTICAGASVNLSASNANGYTWYYLTTPTSSINIATTPSISVTPPVTGPNYYVVKGGGFCGAAPDYDTVKVTVKPIANIEIVPMLDVTKCMYSSYNLNAGVGSLTPGNTGAPYTYQWTMLPGNTPAPGATNSPTYSTNSNGTQTLVLTVTGTCATGDADTVVVKNFPDNLVANILDSVSICSNTPFVLHSAVTGGVPAYTYNWTMQPSTNLGNGPVLNGTSPGTQGNYIITLTVTDSCGITKHKDKIINVLPPCSVIIPNIITPNGDGVNDIFVITNLDKHPNSALTIFDRWGKKVFDSPDYQNNWKADGASDGTFFYILHVPDDKSYSGFITVFHNK